MAHDVFISYAAEDKRVADAICAKLESRRIRCWIAPRDIPPGTAWAAAIVRAIPGSRIMVLVYSSHSNRSQQVPRELERAVSRGLPILPFRIEDVPPSEQMEFYVSSIHWLDAMTPPLEKHIDQLADAVVALLPKTHASHLSTDNGSDEAKITKPDRKLWPQVLLEKIGLAHKDQQRHTAHDSGATNPARRAEAKADAESLHERIASASGRDTESNKSIKSTDVPSIAKMPGLMRTAPILKATKMESEAKQIARPSAKDERQGADQNAHSTATEQKPETQICPGCSHKNLGANIFCNQCGMQLAPNRQAGTNSGSTGLAAPCSNCGRQNPSGNAHCNQCGAKLGS